MKKVFCLKNCFDLSLFEEVVLVISKILRFFLLTRTNFSHSRTEQFSIKIPFLSPHFLVKQKISHRKKLGAKKVPVCKWKLAWNLHCQLRPWGLVSTTSLVEHSDPQQKKYRRIVNWKTCNYLENQLFKISCIRQSS